MDYIALAERSVDPRAANSDSSRFEGPPVFGQDHLFGASATSVISIFTIDYLIDDVAL